MFDLIFIDGMHEAQQVLRDVDNSLNWLTPGMSQAEITACLLFNLGRRQYQLLLHRIHRAGGTIVLHDCSPRTARMASKHQTYGVPWNGDVYRAIIQVCAQQVTHARSLTPSDMKCDCCHLQLRTRPDLQVMVGDFDYGVGLVRRARHAVSSPIDLQRLGWLDEWGRGDISNAEWSFFVEHQVALTGLKPVEEFFPLALVPPGMTSKEQCAI